CGATAPTTCTSSAAAPPSCTASSAPPSLARRAGAGALHIGRHAVLVAGLVVLVAGDARAVEAAVLLLLRTLADAVLVVVRGIDAAATAATARALLAPP